MLADPAGETTLDPRWRASLLVNAGVVYRNLGDPVSAVDACHQAVDLYRHLGDQAALSNAYLNLGLASYLNLSGPPRRRPPTARPCASPAPAATAARRCAASSI